MTIYGTLQQTSLLNAISNTIGEIKEEGEAKHQENNTGGEKSGKRSAEDILQNIILVSAVAVWAAVIIGMVSWLAVSITSSVVAKDYSVIFFCNRCGTSYYTDTDNEYCENCGIKHSDDDFADRKAHCENCGKRAERFGKTHCAKCGGVIESDTKVRIADIEGPFVRWCVKHERF